MKAIKNLILALFLTLFYLNLLGQQTFEKTYYVEGESSTYLNYFPYFISQNSEGDYYFGGNKSISSQENCTFISKVNSNGTPIWSKTISQPGARNIIQTSDGGFLITSSSYGYTSNVEILLIKINELYDTIWTQSIGSQDIFDNTQTKGFASIETGNNQYLTVGYTNSFGVGLTDVILVKTDNNGNNIWSKTIGSTGIEFVIDVQETSDNGFIVCGTTDIESSDDHNACLIKIDSLGNLIWSKSYGGSKYEMPKKIKITSNNGFIVLGYYASPMDDNDILAFETDSIGNLLWAKSFGNILDDNGWDILPLDDGGAVIAGSVQDTTYFDDDIFLAKLNKDGDTVWTRTFGDEYNNIGVTLCKTNDNGFAIAGCTANNFGYDEHNYTSLIKTDYNGNTSCSNFSNIIVTNEEFVQDTLIFQLQDEGYFRHLTDCEISDLDLIDTLLCSFAQNIDRYDLPDEISCFPNPFHESTKLYFDNNMSDYYQLSLFNSTGKLIREYSVSNSSDYLIKRDDLPDGIYFLQISDKSKIIGQIKIVIQ